VREDNQTLPPHVFSRRADINFRPRSNLEVPTQQESFTRPPVRDESNPGPARIVNKDGPGSGSIFRLAMSFAAVDLSHPVL
jgi:hypothetical protein